MHFAIKLQKTWVATTFQIYFTNIEYVEKKSREKKQNFLLLYIDNKKLKLTISKSKIKKEKKCFIKALCLSKPKAVATF